MRVSCAELSPRYHRLVRAGHRLAAGVLLTLAGIGVGLAVCEASLRVAHFHYQPFPMVQFGWPEPRVIVNNFHQDADLLWVTKDYEERLAAVRRTRPDLLFLGDSCVEFSHYPRLVLEQLAARGLVLTGAKLSVPGWSSEQGRAQMSRDLSATRPRVVVVEFGWNDHWDALGPPDADTHPSALAVWADIHLRLFELCMKARDGFEKRRHPDSPRRVSLERYRDNLTAMARMAADMKARLVLVTAPSGHTAGAEPAYLVARHLRHLQDLIPLHQQYVQATRAVAGATGAMLCDAAAAADGAGDARHGLFRHDGIHFTAEGDAFMATLVAGCVDRALGH
jgi:lysophospholipase L1-like esterase